MSRGRGNRGQEAAAQGVAGAPSHLHLHLDLFKSFLLVAQKDPHGTWHSTQATVLALRALLGGTETEKIEGRTGGIGGMFEKTVDVVPVLAELGHEIVGMDVDTFKVETINKGHAPIVEELIGELTKSMVAAGRFRATLGEGQGFTDGRKRKSAQRYEGKEQP